MPNIDNRDNRRIDIADAKITTATVEVRVISINSKQMTLSVFRQLTEEDVINNDMSGFNGSVWGHVNYFWGECQRAGHLHVVWQKGHELRRACLDTIPDRPLVSFPGGDARLTAVVMATLRDVDERNFLINGCRGLSAAEVFLSYRNAMSHVCSSYLCSRIYTPATADRMAMAAEAVSEEAADLRSLILKSWSARYAELAASEQLFVAV